MVERKRKPVPAAAERGAVAVQVRQHRQAALAAETGAAHQHHRRRAAWNVQQLRVRVAQLKDVTKKIQIEAKLQIW